MAISAVPGCPGAGFFPMDQQDASSRPIDHSASRITAHLSLDRLGLALARWLPKAFQLEHVILIPCRPRSPSQGLCTGPSTGYCCDAPFLQVVSPLSLSPLQYVYMGGAERPNSEEGARMGTKGFCLNAGWSIIINSWVLTCLMCTSPLQLFLRSIFLTSGSS